MEDSNSKPTWQLNLRDERSLVMGLQGSWTTRYGGPAENPLISALDDYPATQALELDLSGVSRWDTVLLCFIRQCQDWCQTRQWKLTTSGAPEGVNRLLKLSQSVAEKEGAAKSDDAGSLLARLGRTVQDFLASSQKLLCFLGETILAMTTLLRGRAQIRWSDTLAQIQACGPSALPVVALINFLIGLILAFVGAIQLTQFGAAVYVADLVAIGTVREMSCMMTGIILCGRTGAAFAAQLGTMKVNEEIDAFKTFGISPIEFLVLPRILALFLMMPLLCLFADLISIAGGFLVSTSILDITNVEYINRTLEAITLKSFLLGIFKGAFFGILIAIAGCWCGMECGQNAAAVGEATTSAVVLGITSIIAADGVFAILCNALNI